MEFEHTHVHHTPVHFFLDLSQTVFENNQYLIKTNQILVCDFIFN